MKRYTERYVKAFYMALGMFCAIPFPFHVWDDSCMNLVLPCLPLVGVLTGTLWWAAAELLASGPVHPALAAALVTVMPFLLTGFLHLDGFMDTSDAVLSRRPPEEKRRILKDPHTGAFAVVSLALAVVVQFAAVYAAIDGRKELALLFCINVMSRCCASVSLFSLKAMPHSGYAAMFKRNTGPAHRNFVLVTALLTIIVACLLCGFRGLAVTLVTAAGYAGALAYSYRELGGVSGDLTGYAIVTGELCGLVALALL